MGTKTLRNAQFEDLITNARYEFEGVEGEGRSVVAKFHRNAAGLWGFMLGVTGQELYLIQDERSCFELAKRFSAVTPSRLTHSESASAFERGGARIQTEKLKSGTPLDCPKSKWATD